MDSNHEKKKGIESIKEEKHKYTEEEKRKYNHGWVRGLSP